MCIFLYLFLNIYLCIDQKLNKIKINKKIKRTLGLHVLHKIIQRCKG